MSNIAQQEKFLDPFNAEQGYAIYQLKNDGDLHEYRFTNLETLKRHGKKVERGNYDLVYAVPLESGSHASLDDIYLRFNTNHPVDFTGHSLSVSDVVVFKNGANLYSAYYVDSYDFALLRDFTRDITAQNRPEPDKELKGKKASMYGGDGYLYDKAAEFTAEKDEIMRRHPNSKFVAWDIDDGENKGKYFVRVDEQEPAAAMPPPERGANTGLMDYRQIKWLKVQNSDALLFVRVGDFYEAFGDDAITLSRELDLTLTARAMDGAAERVPMTGVPYHTFNRYIQTLTEKGYKVAIAESLSDGYADKVQGLMIKSQVEGWPDWSTDKLPDDARNAAEWLIKNGYENESDVKNAFYDRQTSSMSDDYHAEEYDNAAIVRVAGKYMDMARDKAAAPDIASEFKAYAAAHRFETEDEYGIRAEQRVFDEVMKDLSGLPADKQVARLFERLRMSEVCGRLLDDDFGYVGGTEGYSNSFFYEKNMIKGFFAHKGRELEQPEAPQTLKEQYAEKMVRALSDFSIDKENVLFRMERILHATEEKMLRDKFEFNYKTYPSTDEGFEDLGGDFSRMLAVNLIDSGLLVASEGNMNDIAKIIKPRADRIMQEMRSADAFMFGDSKDGARHQAAAQFADTVLNEIDDVFFGLEKPDAFANAKAVFTALTHHLLNTIDGAIIRPSERLSAANETNSNNNNQNNVMEDKEMENTVTNDQMRNDPLFGDGADEQTPPPAAESKHRLTPEDYVRLADAEYLKAMREGRYEEIVDGIADLGYSVRNVMLIKNQLPTATKTRGLNSWNYYGRSVLEGTKSLKILAVNEQAADKDADAEGADGEKGGKNYRFSNVFDISQTKASSKARQFDDPTCTPEVLDKYYPGIRRAILQQARDYTLAEGENNAVDFEGKTITVKQGLSREDTLKAMIYAVARVRTEGKARAEGTEISQGRALFHQIEETATAHIVARRLGLGDFKLKTADFSQYDDEGLMRVSTNLHYVKMGAQRITDAVERYISEAQSSDALRAAQAATANTAAPAASRSQPVFAKKSVLEAT
jgi:hypothetical protein